MFMNVAGAEEIWHDRNSGLSLWREPDGVTNADVARLLGECQSAWTESAATNTSPECERLLELREGG
jgi:hypothetical protein